MEKDTQKEPQEVSSEQYVEDYYEDDDSYYFEKAFKSNIKDDPASIRSRPRNIPVGKLQITDEDNIPKMPEKILPMPDTKAIDNKIKAIEEAIKKKGESLNEVRKKKSDAIYGARNDEMDKVYEEHKKLKAELDIIKAKYDKEDEPIKNIRNTIDSMTGDLKKFEKYHFGTNPDSVAAEIKQIQESLSFSQLSITKEKKLSERRAIMSEYYTSLKKLKEFKDTHKTELDASYKRRAELKEKFKPLDELSKKIREYKEKKQKEKKKEKDDPVVNQFNLQIELIKKERDQLYIDKDELYKKKDNDFYEYEVQQKLIDYIKRAKEKINSMRKKIEKDKKKQEKLEKKGQKFDSKTNPEDILTDVQTFVKETKNYKQITNCDFLSSYFSSFITQSDITEIKPQIEEKTNTKLDEDISKGFLLEVKRDDTDNMLGITGDPKKGKKNRKGKKPNENKYETIIIDFNVINKVKEAGLAPPTKRSEIAQFLDALAKKKEEFVKDNVEITVIENINKTDAESTKEGESAQDAK